jgi:hypothetical protein
MPQLRILIHTTEKCFCLAGLQQLCCMSVHPHLCVAARVQAYFYTGGRIADSAVRTSNHSNQLPASTSNSQNKKKLNCAFCISMMVSPRLSVLTLVLTDSRRSLFQQLVVDLNASARPQGVG